MTFRPAHPESVLLLTLDSCRYDTAAATPTPHLAAIGPLRRAMAPGHFTFASHASMWVGTTPGIAETTQPVLNPKAGRLFRLANARAPAQPGDVFVLEGRTILEGFRRRGHAVIGTGSVAWFDTDTEPGRGLVADFDIFHHVRGPGALPAQLAWLEAQLDAVEDRPAFVFVNVGETHVPYWHPGATWSPRDNPCVPFGERNDAATCRTRQSACLAWSDAALGSLLAAFGGATILACADHGDCWGEDGLWEHGVWHEKTMEVPLWVRIRGVPC
ncbi:MAG: hypothetical protein V4850_34945 [Myxococcota bacterium]